MKRILLLLAASMMLASCALPEQAKATRGGNTVRLFDTPCVNLAVLAHIMPAYHARMRKAEATVGGREFAACWIVDGDSARLMYEDGDQGLVPLTDFKPDNGL